MRVCVAGWLLTYPAINCSVLCIGLRSVLIDLSFFSFDFLFFFWRWIETEPEHQKTAVELTLDETSFLQSVDGEKEASPACFDHLFRALSAPSFSFSPSPQLLIDLFPKFFFILWLSLEPQTIIISWLLEYAFNLTRDTEAKEKRQSLVLPSWQV